MTPRQRIMAALALKEPDCVPFADWIDDPVKQNLLKAMGEPQLDDAEFARRLSMDAICFSAGGWVYSGQCKQHHRILQAGKRSGHGRSQE